ncbi:MAG: methylated-DNA--[protein]-cysteine S-methyltransferase [Acidobacteria bacterium]|jgi:methylated-DNA-[protein]-cysteine S-methyltransferase|nr:methylated-DNA--[protein]-cysteine S-methyltransferase [Acidobacteriota bacterium]
MTAQTAGRKRGKSAAPCVYCKSPIGYLRITGSEKWVVAVEFCDQPGPEADGAPECLKKACQQLDEYFHGKRRKFEVPLMLRGTPFQKRVWAALRKVPFGRTLSYGGIARSIGRPYSGRAVGGANHHNPVAIIVPCHRIIGHNGRLTGYGGGLWRKQWLLDHEKKVFGR